MSDKVLADRFTAHEKLLWRVLGVLARSGYVVSPTDARDLIHDFYLEGWPGVVERFDPALSQFSTYLSAAFIRFARRRIVQMREWQARTTDLEAIFDHVSPSQGPEEAAEAREGVQAVRDALRNLPGPERELLHDFVAHAGSSERDLAKAHGLTRYRTRELLASAIGRLATTLGQLPEGESLQAKVVQHLWIEGRTPADVARLLGISTAEVQAARLAFAMELLASVRQFDR